MGGGEVQTLRVRIAGRVQGVGYRYWTERVASELGLSGWVRNCRDGTVEALFSGSPGEVAEMIERCRDGPPSAQVTSVEIQEVAAAPPEGFEVLRTR